MKTISAPAAAPAEWVNAAAELMTANPALAYAGAVALSALAAAWLVKALF